MIYQTNRKYQPRQDLYEDLWKDGKIPFHKNWNRPTCLILGRMII